MSRAYYNEIDKRAAAWLRELMRAGVIAPGEVDERSIKDVVAADLRGFTQCHFFAGIGVWSYALRLAGWSDGRPVWTGSCPCQPWSGAGAQEGFADPRHLWPDWYRLIAECRPLVVFGEQVASKAGLAWLDAVSDDMEASNYAIGSFDLCAASVGAPHVRQRLYWVADAERGAQRRVAGHMVGASSERPSDALAAARGRRATVHLGDPESRGRRECWETVRAGSRGHTDGAGGSVGMGDAERSGLERHAGNGGAGFQPRWVDPETARSIAASGATRGFWGDADWLVCRDGKARPTEPGSFPLVDGTPERVGRLRGYGNAIVADLAATFIEAYLEVAAADVTEGVA